MGILNAKPIKNDKNKIILVPELTEFNKVHFIWSKFDTPKISTI
jgi:hypothetical protein